MSYTPSYTKKNFVNGSAPSINATNLNAMETALANLETNAQTDSARLDSAVTTLAGKANQSDLNALTTVVSGKASATALSDEVTARQNADASLTTTLNNHTTLINNKYDKVYTNNDGAENLTDSDNGLLKNLMVKGKCEQTTFNGYNLINTFVYTRRDGITQISSNGVITVTNNVGGQISGIGFNCSSLPSGQYIFKNYSNVGYYVMLNSSDYSHYISPNQSYAITKADYLNIQGANIAVDATVTFKCMLESGTVAHDYEQYCGGIPSPNPQFPQSIAKVTSAKVVAYHNTYDKDTMNTNSCVSLYESTIRKVDASSNSVYTVVIPIESGKTYNLNLNNANCSYIRYATMDSLITDSASHNAIDYAKLDSATSATFTSSANAKYLYVQSNYASANSWINTLTVVASDEKQSVSTNLTLYGIGSTCDYIDVERGKVVRKFGSVDLGSLSWTYSSSAILFIATMPSDSKSPKNLGNDGLCNKYAIDHSAWETFKTLNNCLQISPSAFNPTTKNVIVRDTSLSSTDIPSGTLVYELATPTETDLDATVLAQLRALTSYYPSTNLVITSDEINGNATFDYPLNLESFIHNVETDVTSLIDALG